MIRLDKSLDDGPDAMRESGRRFKPEPSNGICTRLGDKWTVEAIWRLSLAPGKRLRFSALKREIDGITQRMLTLTLRNLERDGLVVRHYFPEVPPRVEYELTEMGAGILTALESLNFWIQDNLPRIEKNRRAYDDGESVLR
ncbi:winged helix-turn-helix transcriptional regulator [Labrys neptuniae]